MVRWRQLAKTQTLGDVKYAYAANLGLHSPLDEPRSNRFRNSFGASQPREATAQPTTRIVLEGRGRSSQGESQGSAKIYALSPAQGVFGCVAHANPPRARGEAL